MTSQAASPSLRANFKYLYQDVFWFGVQAGSAMAFITIFATRLGASAFQISLLTAGPAVVNLLFSLPAGQWMSGRSLTGLAFWSSVWHRLGYLLLVPLPWLFPDLFKIWVIVLVTLLISIPGTLLAISFNALFAEVVPAEWRAEVVGKRNALMAISITLTSLLSGQLLDGLPYPLNYGVVFAIGALGASVSTYYLRKLRLPSAGDAGAEQQLLVRPDPAVRRTIPGLRGMPGLELLRTSYGPFLLAYLLFYTFQYLGVPIFPLVQVSVLKLSDGAISLGSGLFYLAMLLVSLRIIEISARLGHKRSLVFGAMLYSAYPLFLGLARGPALFWVASLTGGGAWAIANPGLVNRLMEKTPEAQRSSGMALHNLALNLGILLGSLAAPLLGDWAGLQTALLIVGGLRFLVGGIFWLWG